MTATGMYRSNSSSPRPVIPTGPEDFMETFRSPHQPGAHQPYRLAASGQVAPEPAAVEALEVREVLVQHRVPRRHAFRLQQVAGRRAVVLPQLHPVALGVRERRVDLLVELV